MNVVIVKHRRLAGKSNGLHRMTRGIHRAVDSVTLSYAANDFA
jgi:hypothetical protein